MRRPVRAGVVLSLLAAGFSAMAPATPAAADHGDSETYFDVDLEVDAPQNLTEGPDGLIWFTSPGNDRVGRIDPDAADPASTIETFDATVDAPWDITTGPDGNLWFTADTAIGRITPAGVVTTFPDANIAGGHDIVAFEDELWFTSTDNDRLGTITTAGVITTLPDAGLEGPTGITVGPFTEVIPTGLHTPPDLVQYDVIWFANTGADDIGFLGLDGSTFRYQAPDGLEAPTDIEGDPSLFGQLYGGGVWFNSGGGRTGVCQADSFAVGGCALYDPDVTDTGPLAFGPHVPGLASTKWQVDLADDTAVTHPYSSGEDPESFELTDASGITDLLVRDDGDLWFTSGANDGIGRLDVDGDVPTLTVTGIEDGDEILRTELPAVTYSCADPAGGTGIQECGASYDGLFASGQTLPDDGVGPRTLRVYAVDNWGNGVTQVIHYTVLPTTSCEGRRATAELAFGDDPVGGNEPNVIVGTPGDDHVQLSSNDYVLCTGEGDDVIDAHGAHLEAHLGPGDDVVREHWGGVAFGGPGDDRITTAGGARLVGEGGDDVLRGGEGADVLDGGTGDDRLFGGLANDLLRGRAGRDRLDGGQAGDHLLGGDADDVLYGRDQADVLDGGTGNDLLNGGAGRDLCTGGPGARDRQGACELRSGFP